LRALRGEANGATADRRRIARLQVEIHKKFAIPAACVIFVLVGAPLGIRTHRGSVGMAIGISFAFFLVYYIFLIGGENLADRGVISPVAAMWGGNVMAGTVGIWILHRVERDLPLWPALPPGISFRRGQHPRGGGEPTAAR
jgi:lipopolysaccharide export system permease protein